MDIVFLKNELAKSGAFLQKKPIPAFYNTKSTLTPVQFLEDKTWRIDYQQISRNRVPFLRWFLIVERTTVQIFKELA